jgi:hypothetical protein
MVTIQESFIELVDLNTSLIHLSSVPPGGTLRLSTSDEYRTLYQQIASDPTAYAAQTDGPREILRQLKPSYHPNKYWRRYYNSSEVDTYCNSVWERLVPIEARLKLRLTALPGALAKVKVSPVPRVLLYPFGWSTWISLRILGRHDLTALAALLRRFLREPAYELSPSTTPAQDSQGIFAQIGKGVWKDAFGGGEKTAASPLEVLSITTVLDKSGGGPSLLALEKEETAALTALVAPDHSGKDHLPSDAIQYLPQGQKGTDFVLQKGTSVFLWADHLLKSQGQNRQRLYCYHHNTLLSLIHAWQLTAFLSQASRSKDRTSALEDLVSAAVEQIDQQLAKGDGYRNLPLLSYLQRDNVQNILKKARTVFKI